MDWISVEKDFRTKQYQSYSSVKYVYVFKRSYIIKTWKDHVRNAVDIYQRVVNT